jgi:hypothetical protein
MRIPILSDADSGHCGESDAAAEGEVDPDQSQPRIPPAAQPA